jgi:hypothetical protein
MTDTNTQEVQNQDFESMSLDELGQFIDASNNIENPVESKIEEESSPEIPEPIEESDDSLNDVTHASDGTGDDNSTETDTQNQQEGNFDTSIGDDNPFFKGKSRDELIDIIQHGTQKISRQQNEINNFRLRYEKNNTTLENKNVNEKQPIDDLYEHYDKDDVESIQQIVRQTLKAEDENNRRQQELVLESNENQNQIAWKSLSNLLNVQNPEVARSIEDQLNTEIATMGRERTLQVPEWVNQKVQGLLPQLNTSNNLNQTNSNMNIRRKKASAATASSGGGTVSGDSSMKGKPEPSDPEQYVQWLAQNHGLNI